MSVSFLVTTDEMLSEVRHPGSTVGALLALVWPLLSMNSGLVLVKNPRIVVLILAAGALENLVKVHLFHILTGLLMSTQVIRTVGVVPTVALEMLEFFLVFHPQMDYHMPKEVAFLVC